MEIRTFTNFWTADMKMYSVNDIALPFPISLRILGTFVGAAIPWAFVMNLFHVPLETPWHVLWVSFPLLVAFAASGNFYEKKSLFQFVKSRVGHFMEEKRYRGLEKDLNRYESEQTQLNIILPLDILPLEEDDSKS